MQSGSTIDTGFICCATCRYWTGYTEYHFPGTMTIDNSSKGNCNKTYLGAEIAAMGSCMNWERRYD